MYYPAMLHLLGQIEDELKVSSSMGRVAAICVVLVLVVVVIKAVGRKKK